MNRVTLTSGDALLIIDMQKDFLPGGALGVTGGDRLIPMINRTIEQFTKAGLPIYASRDWHPPRHCSFQEQGGSWPPHCIAGSPGAEFADNLSLPADAQIISKGTDTRSDAYSAFDRTALASRLRAEGIKRVFICGLTSEYCVLSSTADALGSGFKVFVLSDAIGAIEIQPGDGARAVGAMQRAGAIVLSSREIGI